MEHEHFPFSIIMGNDILDISETTDIVQKYQGYCHPIANPSARNNNGTQTFPQTDRSLLHDTQPETLHPTCIFESLLVRTAQLEAYMNNCRYEHQPQVLECNENILLRLKVDVIFSLLISGCQA